MMSTLEMTSRFALAVVFVIAAASKTLRRGGAGDFARAIRGFGVPPRAVVAVAGGVIAAEISIVVLLALHPALGHLAALVVVTGFTAGIVHALRKGRSVACRCFGAGETPISTSTAVRNAVLALLAALGLIGHGTAALAPITSASWLAAVMGVMFGLLLTRWDDLTFLIMSRPPQPSRSTHDGGTSSWPVS